MLPQIPSSATTPAHINPVSSRTQKVGQVSTQRDVKYFLRGLKKHIHFTVSSLGGLPAGKKTTQPIEKRVVLGIFFAPVLKQQGKLFIL